MITIDDFAKIEIKVGTVLEAIKVPEADRLIKLIFDFGPLSSVIVPQGHLLQSSGASEAKQSQAGEEIATSQAPRDDEKRDVRQIMSAIAPFFPDPSVLVGKQICVITNLEPRKFKGYESQGMIMAVDGPEGGIVLISPEKPVPAGTKAH